jgi:hypothetical protein
MIVQRISNKKLKMLKNSFYVVSAVKVPLKLPPAELKKDVANFFDLDGRNKTVSIFDFPSKEKAVCPAVLFRGEVYINSLEGLSIHPEITRAIAKMFDMSYSDVERGSTEGFLTSSGYFLTRKEAFHQFRITDSLQLDTNKEKGRGWVY